MRTPTTMNLDIYTLCICELYVLGVGYSILNQMPSLHLPQFLAHGAMFSIFIGALLWLAGACISGREKVEDRYYWLRHYGDKRCRRSHHSHH